MPPIATVQEVTVALMQVVLTRKQRPNLARPRSLESLFQLIAGPSSDVWTTDGGPQQRQKCLPTALLSFPFPGLLLVRGEWPLSLGGGLH